MTFAGYSLFTSPFKNVVGIFVIGLPSEWFIGRPIETERAIIEQRRESLPVRFFLVGIAATREEKQIAAEKKIMALLLNGNFCSRHRFARRVHDAEHCAALAMALDACVGRSQNLRVGRRGRFFFSAPGRSG